MIIDCILEYAIHYYINISVKVKSDEYDYNKRQYESIGTKIINNKKRYIKQHNNDTIYFIDQIIS